VRAFCALDDPSSVGHEDGDRRCQQHLGGYAPKNKITYSAVGKGADYEKIRLMGGYVLGDGFGSRLFCYIHPIHSRGNAVVMEIARQLFD
jgi:hypothetical protein